MGAGAGGKTSKIVALPASLGVSVTYSISDISSSLVAAARKRFKQYSFVNYCVVDIESKPPSELVDSYHLVLATNCVHATRSLAHSTSNIRKMLRSDGFLLMLGMTEPFAWVNLVFGPLDG
jgi:SAM-dependent methyltransferase